MKQVLRIAGIVVLSALAVPFLLAFLGGGGGAWLIGGGIIRLAEGGEK